MNAFFTNIFFGFSVCNDFFIYWNGDERSRFGCAPQSKWSKCPFILCDPADNLKEGSLLVMLIWYVKKRQWEHIKEWTMLVVARVVDKVDQLVLLCWIWSSMIHLR